MNKVVHWTLVALVAFPPSITPAFAQRGGGRGGGGARGGGGRMAGGASAGRPSFNRTPSFTPPSGGRPGGMGGGGVGAARPSMPTARPAPVNRPNLGGGQGSPGAGITPGRPPIGGANRPGVNPGQPGGNPGRPSVGGPNRPGINPGQPGVNPNRPGLGGPNRPGVDPGQPGVGGPNRPGNNPNRPGVGGPNQPGVTPGRPPIAGRPPGGLNPARPPAWGPGGGAGRPPSWGGGRPPAWASRPGWNNHQAWVNGYWHGQNNNWWNNGGAFFTGMAVGGIGAWGLNSAIYGWGYRSFYNPYAVAVQPIVVQQPIILQQPVVVDSGVAAAPAQSGVYDYSQPLVAGTPPEPSVADPAMQTFDAARAAFKAGDYNQALKLTDEALKSLPDDAAIHEFRALCFFAMKDYDQAAGVLYAVLSVGPGWDWTTLIGLYPSVDVYTAQLRALEDFRTANPRSASSRFVLGYHYLTQGHAEAAITEFKDVTTLQPSDELSAQLVELISGSQAPEGTAVAEAGTPPAATPTTAPDATQGAPEGDLVGAWKASPEAGVSIALTITKDGDFTWNLTQQGKTQPITGRYTYGSGILTLAQSDDNVMVGRVSWKDAGHFVFQAMGGGPNDPGLTFSK